MSVSKVAAAAWLSSAVVVVGAAGGAIYQLANPSNTASQSPTSNSQPTSPSLGGGNVSPGNSGNGNGTTTGNGNGTTGATTGNGTTGTGATTGAATTGGNTNGTTNGNGNGNGTTGGTTGSNPGHPITVTGAVVGKISLGSPATLNVTIANPNNQDILVISVTGAITSVTSAGLAGRPACSSSWYSVGAFTGSKTITKNSSGQVSIPLTLTNLPSTNQDNCKGSTVQFSFTAQARQA